MPSATQRHLRAGTMLGRRTAFEHGEPDAGAFRPFIALGLRRAASLGHRAFDDIHALVEAVAAEAGVGGILPYRFDPVARPDHVLAADFERIDFEQLCQLVDRRLDRESRLRCAIAAKTAAWHHVSVDRVADGLLVGAPIDSHRAAERCRQRLAAVAAIRAGVGDHMDLDRGQGPVHLAPSLTRVVI